MEFEEKGEKILLDLRRERGNDSEYLRALYHTWNKTMSNISIFECCDAL
jgi:hypothetical protein